MVLRALALAAFFLGGTPVAAADTAPLVQVRVTQRDLVPRCLDGGPTTRGTRRFRLGVGTHSMAFAMRSKAGGALPGVAVVSFTLEAGHKYEVEVRASPNAFSSRIWERGEWTPVVRDRTVDRLVSGEPKWRDTGCE